MSTYVAPMTMIIDPSSKIYNTFLTNIFSKHTKSSITYLKLIILYDFTYLPSFSFQGINVGVRTTLIISLFIIV
jgi:hypothetical protein